MRYIPAPLKHKTSYRYHRPLSASISPESEFAYNPDTSPASEEENDIIYGQRAQFYQHSILFHLRPSRVYTGFGSSLWQAKMYEISKEERDAMWAEGQGFERRKALYERDGWVSTEILERRKWRDIYVVPRGPPAMLTFKRHGHDFRWHEL